MGGGLPIGLMKRLYDLIARGPAPGARRRFAKVAETFFTELSVLFFLFPVLDEYVSHGKVSHALLFESLCASGIAFAIAGAIAAYRED